MEIIDIKDAQFLKTLSLEELDDLSKKIRIFLIKSIASTGGHLSSNLGVVDLTMALYYVFNPPQDRLIFDVGHQSYTHKILSGRAPQFSSLRQFKGLSGYQKRKESVYDTWEAGHSSTSLSAALGMAVARDLNHDNYEVIPIIGDGALTGGMALEALNHIGCSKSKVIIILNDNEMSISKNVGGVNELMQDLRMSMPYNKMKQEYKEMMSHSKFSKTIYSVSKKAKNFIKKKVVPNNIFTEFGIEYIGPVDGHDFKDLIRALNKAKRHPSSIVVHVLTKKGRGYHYSEVDHNGNWHGVGTFDYLTGQSNEVTPQNQISWSQLIADHVRYLMNKNEAIVTITPAMIKGSKLEQIFDEFPNRSFDVGIAEEHATTFAAGLAANGKHPFISIYSSFLQRAYDQINHDVARMDLPIVFGVDRAGLVGEDGETHHGVFDISMLQSIPNIILAMPKDMNEAQILLNTGFSQSHPFFIRYPRGNTDNIHSHSDEKIKIGSWEIIHEPHNKTAIVISYGPNVIELLNHIKKADKPWMVVNARFIKPIDDNLLKMLAQQQLPIFVYETDIQNGSLYSKVIMSLNEFDYKGKIISYAIKDHYTEQGKVEELIEAEALSIPHVVKDIEGHLNE